MLIKILSTFITDVSKAAYDVLTADNKVEDDQIMGLPVEDPDYPIRVVKMRDSNIRDKEKEESDDDEI